MGSLLCKSKPVTDEISGGLKQKVRILEVEIMEMRRKWEEECRAYEQQAVSFIGTEARWKREKKKWKEEVRRLKTRLEEKEEKIRKLEGKEEKEEEAMASVNGKSDRDDEWENFGGRAEQALREEAAQKWKRLYLIIKTELDDLIHRTQPGERLWWGGEEIDVIEDLKRQVEGKEEMVEGLRAKLAWMEKEGVKREREIDILRQSLRIMSNTKGTNTHKKRSSNLYKKFLITSLKDGFLKANEEK